jgi:type I restriction enzyme S subunit
MTKSSLPKGWRFVKFGDVVDNMNETTRDPEAIGLDRVVGLDHMDPESLPLKRWDNLSDLHEGTSFTRVFRVGQVLFGKRRAYQRKVSLPGFDGICSGDILVFQPKNTELLPEFLPYLVQSDGFFDHALGTSAGSLSPRTKWQELAKYEFALPPITEQHRIIKLMLAIDDALTSNASVDIDPLLESLYWSNHQLDDECVKLGEVVAQGGVSIRELPSESTIDYIDLSCVSREFGIEHREIKKYLVSEAPSRAQKIVQTNDLLIATVRPNLRATARVAAQENGWVASTGFAVLRPRGEVETSFLHGLIRTNAFTNYLVEKATGSNYPAVRPREIENFLIPVSKWKRRTEIARSADLLMQINRDLASNLMALRNVRRATLESLIEVGVNV